MTPELTGKTVAITGAIAVSAPRGPAFAAGGANVVLLARDREGRSRHWPRDRAGPPLPCPATSPATGSGWPSLAAAADTLGASTVVN